MTVASFIHKLEQESRKHKIAVPSVKIEEKVNENNAALNKVIKEELQDFFSLLDLGISAIIEMHYICKNKEFVFASITSKLVSQLLSIRTLLMQGQMDGVKSIYRPFREMIEIFFACLIDKDFAEKYGNPNILYDNNEFWRKNINGNKLDKYINKIFDELNYPKESKKEYFKRREKSREFLSETSHSSFNSTFSSFIMPTMDRDFSDNIYGKITTAYPMAIYEILTDICMLNAVFFLAVDKEKAFAFSRSDITGSDKINYNHFMKAYDTTYDLYNQDLYKRAYEISKALGEVYDYLKKLEEPDNV